MADLDLVTLHEALAVEFADEPCVIVAGEVWTWSEVTDRTRRLASVLREAGLGGSPAPVAGPATETGQHHLGILLHNGLEYLEATLGAAKAAVVPFNINYRYTASELEYLLKDARPSALVYAGAFAGLVAEMLPSLSEAPLLIQVADGSDVDLLPGAVDYEQALSSASPRVFPTSSEDRHIVYTGGTTGMPKGVIWRNADLLAGPLGVRARDGSSFRDVSQAVERARSIRGRVLPASPMMHAAGMAVSLGGWLGGGAVVIPERPRSFDASAFLDSVERDKVTSAMIIGDAFGAPIVAELARKPRDLSSLRLIVSSGAALRDELKEELKAALPGLRITDFIGSSEGMKAKKDKAGGNRLDARGGVAVLSEDRTRVLEPGADEIGWLAQGGAVPLGYLRDAEKTAATFFSVDGRRFSVGGDRARMSPDGGIEFLGRDATTINTAGEKVFTDEVEQVLRTLPGVADAVVVGRPSEKWGQEVVALLQLDSGVELDAERLSEGCRLQLAGYKVPKAFIVVPEVGRHANGKPDYKWAGQAAQA